MTASNSNARPLVSVIVPIYNAERFLGYCLNSLVRQTYTHWQAILVDDGSTDGSREIALRYAELDSRFRVISIPNGGVSNARNVGLEQAEGTYLHFLDSDDVLAPETLARQVAAAEQYGKQLVVSDVLIADFTDPDRYGPRLSAKWLGAKPAVLDAEEFRQKRMQLIWHTALLEGLYGKLYDRSLWERLHLRFPEQLSLGEDFVTNLQYYAACNGVVFLQQIGHYYNNICNSDSLTHKYRPDLFETKMYLMERLWEHLHKNSPLSPPELTCFHNYVAGTGLRCVDEIVGLEHTLTKQQKRERLAEICGNRLFYDSLGKADYFPEAFASYVPAIREGRTADLLRPLPQAKPNTTLLNRIIRKCMRTVRPLAGQRGGAVLERWEQSFAAHGLRNTISSHRRSRKRPSTAQLEQSVQALEDTLYARMAALDEQITDTAANLTAEADRQRETLYRELREYQWLSEQRMTLARSMAEINDLRQRKKALLLCTAEHQNIGDAAIVLAEQQLLSKLFPDLYQVEISTYEYDRREAFLHSILHPDDIIFIHGGGNLGDLYPTEEALRCKIISEFPDHKIIILPQTICFSDAEALARSARVYSRHPDLTLFVRGQTSLELARTHFPTLPAYLMPDSVHGLQIDYGFDRDGALLCLREDAEGILSNAQKDSIRSTAQHLCGTVEECTNIHDTDINRCIRPLVVRRELMRHAKHRVVITDRLHGLIFAAVTGTPCVLLSSYNHKLGEYAESFFADSNAVFPIGTDMERLDDAIRSALSVTEPRWPVFAASHYETLLKQAVNP